MGKRRQAREAALQVLFGMDVAGRSAEEAWQAAREAAGELPPETEKFARELVDGTLQQRAEIDAEIQRHARNWDLSRMAAADRNILRLATFELLHQPGTPAEVVMDEAIELAKKYSTAESGRFVNGVLDAIAKDVRRL